MSTSQMAYHSPPQKELNFRLIQAISMRSLPSSKNTFERVDSGRNLRSMYYSTCSVTSFLLRVGDEDNLPIVQPLFIERWWVLIFLVRAEFDAGGGHIKGIKREFGLKLAIIVAEVTVL